MTGVQEIGAQVKPLRLSISAFVFFGNTLRLPWLLVVVTGPCGACVYGSLASVIMHRGSCGYNVTYHHQRVNG